MQTNLIHKYAETLKSNDKDFFVRVWNTPDELYINRLKAIAFERLDVVLDAGFGFGQWLLPLSKLNRKVIGIEYSQVRYKTVQSMLSEAHIENIEVLNGSIEKIELPDNSVDAIFSYSVILCTDYRKSLSEFYRVLKPGGKLYFNTNGLGWYLYNLLEGHNSSDTFSARDMAIDSFENTIKYFSQGVHKPGSCIITPSETILMDLKQIGFSEISHGAEGSLKVIPSITAKSFFKGEYYNHEGVIEFLCTKK
jgi:ubiquinone/menaquinone biosynthesis C-methylase UbiE